MLSRDPTRTWAKDVASPTRTCAAGLAVAEGVPTPNTENRIATANEASQQIVRATQ